MMGNEILRCLGSEDEINDVETFTYDTLYLQLFDSFFPELELDKVQPGETPEEMAQNIESLINLMAESIVSMDLSFLSAQSIVEGDTTHIAQFLQLILEVIIHLA